LSPVTHFLTGWVVSCSVPSLSVKERGLITFAGIVPDIDGLGAIPDFITRNSNHPSEWFSLYHHQLHNLAFGLLIAGIVFVFANQRWTASLLALFSFHLHLFEDILGGRGPDGYQWPIPYLMPFSNKVQLSWKGQWALNAWPNILLTICLLLITFYLAWSTGYSPLELFSTRANEVFVTALRRRFIRNSTV
jgi:LexA-binding, inner membrane-associated putative hydrolase